MENLILLSGVLPFLTRQYRLDTAMYAVNSGGVSADSGHESRVRCALAGVQAGMLGSLLIFACLAIGSLWNGHSIWATPNLFATTFLGGAVYRDHFVQASWTGLAIIFALYGLLGGVWGLVWGARPRRWLAVYGAVAGLAVYFLLFDFAWKHLNPLMPVYAPERQLQIGHVLWGIALARSPLYARRISQAASPGIPVPPEPQDAEAQEIRSGEVIR